MFYKGLRLWEAHLYVFYVSGRLSGGAAFNEAVGKGGSAKEYPHACGGRGGGVAERSSSSIRVLRVVEALGGSFVRVLRVREAPGCSFVVFYVVLGNFRSKVVKKDVFIVLCDQKVR